MAEPLTFTAPVTIAAAAAVEGQPPRKPTFEMLAYTGAPMSVAGYWSPVVVDLAGVKTENDALPILLDHDTAQIVGQGVAIVDAGAIRISGDVMGNSPEATKVVALAKDGFRWQASIGANVTRREFLEGGKKTQVNGREVTGPLIIARETTLKEVSFVAIGADSKTSAAVAASSPPRKDTTVDANFKAWLESNGYTAVDTMTEQQLKPLAAAWKAETAPPPVAQPARRSDVDTLLAEARADNERREMIADVTARFLAESPGIAPDMIAKIETLAGAAAAAKWSADKYEHELLKATRVQAPVYRPSAINGRPQMTNRVLEAAICATGRLENYEKLYDDQTLQAAHDQFPHGIGLRQLMLICAEANGYRGNYASEVTIEVQRAAFGMIAPNRLQATTGFSTISISTTLSNVANKFLMNGWNAVDLTPLRIAKIRPVRDFKQITTVSLTGDVMYQQVGPGGEIKHGTLGETVYNNQANTYARMLAVTRTDIINDDLGALTEVPFKLGRGAGLKLNDIFWTIFLGAEAAGFFSAGNKNNNTGVGDMTTAGLATTEALFMAQVDPDGYPLGIQPAIIVVPIAQRAAAATLMNSERLITGNTTTQGDANIWRDRFRIESSPYMSNTVYTGNSGVAWYMLADPAVLPMVEIAALNGRVEPTVQSADADFNVLGMQMRGFSDIGVALQEFRAAVKADGTP